MNVNLDSLIKREDFEILNPEADNLTIQVLQIRDLEETAFVYKTLRKPDFQRETNEWNTEKIVDFIESFLNGDLIPSIILWNANGINFVIDGAHRLSALISWVIDDYGDGIISSPYFDHEIPKEQRKVAEKTRAKIKKEIGTYKQFKNAIINPDSVEVNFLKRAQRLATLGLQLQWVKGNAEKAEESFFKINEKATPINDTEKRLLRLRKKPNAIAARAIVRSGTGHKYWNKFSEEVQAEIRIKAKEINDLLFIPELETPIKTLDLPLAGKGYSSKTLSLILDVVNITNKKDFKSAIENDKDGSMTIVYLKNTKKILKRLVGNEPSSLGLHPVVYFYSISGRYQVTAFYSILQKFTDELGNNKYFEDFTTIRNKFEEFLLSYKTIVNQVNTKYGSGLKSHKKLVKLFSFIQDKLRLNLSNDKIILELSQNEDFSFLKPEETFWKKVEGNTFSSSTKSGRFLIEALDNPIRCEICQGLIHRNSISLDHIVRKEDGGTGHIGNSQLSHPYCNSTIKN